MWQQMQQLYESLTDTQSKLILTLVILILSWILRRIMYQSIKRLHHNAQARYTWSKTSNYVFYIIAFISIAMVWSNHIDNIATFLGLLSAGLAFAFKDPIANFAGWYFIVFQKPFKVGDRIQTENLIGDVIDINLFNFTIIEIGHWVDAEQSTGRIVHIPNAVVFTKNISNYNEGINLIWNELKVRITFESDWQLAKELLMKLINEKAPNVEQKAKKELDVAASQYLIFYHNMTPIVYTNVKEYGIELSIRYLCPPKKRRTSTGELWETILVLFQEPAYKDKIQLAYPTTRFVHDKKESMNQPNTKPI